MLRASLKPFLLALGLAAASGLVVYRSLEKGAAGPAISAAVADIRVISRGEPFNLRDYLVAGKYTLFDYYADWCPPCREIAPALLEMAQAHPEVAIRKIDIVDWSHPVAAQQRVDGLPFFRLYDPEGRLIREGEETVDDLARRFGLRVPAGTSRRAP